MSDVGWLAVLILVVLGLLVLGGARKAEPRASLPECCAYGDDAATLLCWPCREVAAPPMPPDPPCEAPPGMMRICASAATQGRIAGVVFRRDER
jgi:hypothetical protein